MIDKRPALIARCASTADVVSAVNFGREHGPMIADILHFLRLLFKNERTGREPDRPLKQQSIHIVRE